MRYGVAVFLWIAVCREPGEPLTRECGEPDVEPREAGDENPYAQDYPGRDWCSDEYATDVAISGHPFRMAIAANDATFEESSRIRVIAWHTDAAGDPVEVEASFEWEVADPELLRIMTVGEGAGAAMLWTLQDRFDEESGRDPETTVVVCVRNDCERACGPCEWRVCADPVIVTGVPNLEGQWEIEADSLPFPVVVDVRQDGERLITVISDLEARLEQDNVRFALREELYSGTVLSRDAIEGEILRYSEEGGDYVVGRWSTQRVPDSE